MTKQRKDKIDEEISLCNGCHCMTKSIKKGRAYWVCSKCGHNKTLSDVYQYEAKEKLNETKKTKSFRCKRIKKR